MILSLYVTNSCWLVARVISDREASHGVRRIGCLIDASYGVEARVGFREFLGG